MCINFPNDYEGFTIASSFTKQNCAGVPKKDEQSQIDYALKNPQYILQVKAPTQIYITLKQNDGNTKISNNYLFNFLILINKILNRKTFLWRIIPL